MRTVPKWVNKIHEADKVEFSSVHSICFNPDGTQLVIGAGERVMVYDPNDGALIQLLQAHKGTVHCVAYARDGKKFASGSADKNVIIWTSKMEGVLKYSHNEAIQCLAYNPITSQLASCGLSDFAFWSAEVKAVQKHKVSGRITSCSWSPDGHFLAMGLASGFVTIRNKNGEEQQRISREGCAIWAVVWSGATLLVTDWTDTLSFYNASGQQVLKDRNIGISALSISLLGELILVAGVGGWAVLTSEGVPIVNTNYEWVWCIQPCPSNNTMALACQDGTLWCYQVVFSTVHGLYRERYAYRENMTDVIIQHLTTGAKVRIKCHDRVQKIAIYKHRLAVQLPERVVVYEQGDADGMLYRVNEKLPQRMECSLLVATSDSLLLCQDTKLLAIGSRIPKSWNVPAPIRYVKVATMQYKEVLLLGLLNGQVWIVELNGPSSNVLLETPSAVRCFDLSASKKKLAVVDEKSVCRVYDIGSRELLYQEENVSSVSWNYSCEELICLSGGGMLSIKAGNYPASSQPLAGSVVGFQGGRVFCLQSNAMQTINVPLSHAMHQYTQNRMFSEAYAVACLGVTLTDWERLGFAALEELSLEVAMKAFQRSENVTFLFLIDNLQERLDSGEKRGIIIGEILAHRGKLTDAARSFRSAGRDDRALHMYTDLRMFGKAQEYLGVGDSGAALVRKRAEWARHVNEPRAAVDMFLAAGDVLRAAEIMAENGWIEMLIETGRKIDKGSGDSLQHIASALVKAGQPSAAADVYQRLGEYLQVAQLAVAAGDWQRAFALAKDHPECKEHVYVPYANAMAKEDKFVEAQKAFHMGGQTETALRVLSILVKNAIHEERFSDASYMYCLLATQCMEMLQASTENGKDAMLLNQYYENDRLACIYHAYDVVHQSIHEPFSLCQPETLFNAARYILSMVGDDKETPLGVSLFCVYLCLAKQAKSMGGNTIARQMLDNMLGLQIPSKFQESVDLLTLKTRAAIPSSSASSDGASDDELAALCWCCRRHATPPRVGTCHHCGHLMRHSYVSFEVIPLVEFKPADDISVDEAIRLIESVPFFEKTEGAGKYGEGGAQIMQINGSNNVDYNDPFVNRMDEDSDLPLVVCNRQELIALNPTSILVVKRPAPLTTQFLRNMLPDIFVTLCDNCQKTFYMEDYEMHLITKGCCPFCRYKKSESDEEDGDMDAMFDGNVLNGHSSISSKSSPFHTPEFK